MSDRQLLRSAGLAGIFCLFAVTVGAAPVTGQQIQTAAMAAEGAHSGRAAATGVCSGPSQSRHIKQIVPLIHEGLHVGSVVSWQEGGFYVMASDDELPPWKVYTPHGNFDDLPPAFQKIIRLEMSQGFQ